LPHCFTTYFQWFCIHCMMFIKQMHIQGVHKRISGL
jgi:hypothetical protein